MRKNSENNLSAVFFGASEKVGVFTLKLKGAGK